MTVTVLTNIAARAHAAAYEVFIDVANDDAAPTPTPEPTPEPTGFVRGMVYSTRSICDYDCIFRWVVTRRTEKSVWLQSVRLKDDGTYERYGEITRRSITSHYSDGGEMVYPSGKYSMCPILTADKTEGKY